MENKQMHENTVGSELPAPPCSEFIDIRDIAEVRRRTGIELRGDDGKPYCCGQRMQVKSGVMGPDYAKCHACGQAIGNAASPHINGGYIPTDEFVKSGKTWVRLSYPNAKVKHER